jgi:hypothetical protein
VIEDHFRNTEREIIMKTFTQMLRSLPLALVAFLVTATHLNAWHISVQNSPSQIWSGYGMAAQNMLNQGWHPTAVDVDYTASNNDYTHLMMCLVKKEGVFNIPAKVVYDKTWEWIADYANQIGYTVVDHDEYLKNGEKRYAAILHDLNPFVPWFAFTECTTPSLENRVDWYGGYVVDLDIEQNGADTLFGTIHFSNGYSGVRWDSSIAWADISPYFHSANKRILDLSRRTDGKYCALFCNESASDVGKWSYFGNASWTWLQNAQDAGWRVQKCNRLRIGDTTTYSGVLVGKWGAPYSN